jgi:uncharacterized protein YndB with AHSA1/START domain
MNREPTGILRRTPDGRDLVLIREFRADIEDVWASITEPERTARWFASWTGDPGPGRTIRYRMVFEGEDPPESEMRIDACDPPYHLAVSATDDFGTWRLEARLRQDGEVTTLEFVHHLDERANPGEVGPGWEYYLDQLVASRDGSPLPNFDGYFPAQQAHYEHLNAQL